MFCKNCGKEVRENDEFCTHCGCTLNSNNAQSSSDVAKLSALRSRCLVMLFIFCNYFAVFSFYFLKRASLKLKDDDFDSAKIDIWLAKFFAYYLLPLSIIINCLILYYVLFWVWTVLSPLYSRY